MARDLLPTSPTILTKKFGEHGDEDPWHARHQDKAPRYMSQIFVSSG
jgi:hypothetical protein